jgi:hypothetical protein
MRPLLICDADEVLLQFVQGFEQFLDDQALRLSLDSFALHGNIRCRTTGEPVEGTRVSGLIDQFFVERIDQIDAVEGAAEALDQLSQIADIIILTNVADDLRTRREAALHRLGMPYPVRTNSGWKGEPVRALADGRPRVAFVDDLPPHHSAVAKAAPEVLRLHFVADARLRPLMPAAPDAHARIDDWPLALPYLMAHLTG